MEANETRRHQAHLALLLAGVALVGALAILPWHTYAISVPGAGSFRFERTGLQSPEEGLGRLALAAAIALVLVGGVVVLRRRAQADLGPSGDRLLMALSLVVAALLFVKLVANTDFLGTGAWISVALGVVIAWAGVSLRPRSR